MAFDRTHFASLGCPGSVTWNGQIKQMFTATDIAHMKTKGIDLSDYTSVKINAVAIYTQVKSGSMPPAGSGEGAWPADWVNTFGCWIQQNCPEG